MVLSRRNALLLPLALAPLAQAPWTSARAADARNLISTAPDRAEKLEAAAKAEGALSLYTSIAQKDLAPLTEPFGKRYGIKLNVWRASGDTVLQRILQEQRARRYTVDVVHVDTPNLEALRREKLLQPTLSPHFADLIQGAAPPHHEWVNTLLSVFVQAYNTDLVKRSELPTSYRDLLDPKWQGKLGFEAEDSDWFATVAKALGGEAGVQFFRDLVARNGLSVRKGHSLLNNLVIAGEVPLALTVYNYMPEQAKAKGAPVDWFVLEPAVARPNGAAVLKEAQSPNAAALFVDYLLSDGQDILKSLNYVPTSRRIETAFKDVRLDIVDPADKLDEGETWDALYQQIILKRSR